MVPCRDCAGLCLLSKYTGVFHVPCAFLFLIVHRNYRCWLLRKEPYIALVIALIIFTPVIFGTWSTTGRLLPSR